MKVQIIKMKHFIKEGSTIKYLWAIIGDHGKTMLQIFSEKYPEEWEEYFKLPIKKK